MPHALSTQPVQGAAQLQATSAPSWTMSPATWGGAAASPYAWHRTEAERSMAAATYMQQAQAAQAHAAYMRQVQSYNSAYYGQAAGHYGATALVPDQGMSQAVPPWMSYPGVHQQSAQPPAQLAQVPQAPTSSITTTTAEAKDLSPRSSILQLSGAWGALTASKKEEDKKTSKKKDDKPDDTVTESKKGSGKGRKTGKDAAGSGGSQATTVPPWVPYTGSQSTPPPPQQAPTIPTSGNTTSGKKESGALSPRSQILTLTGAWGALNEAKKDDDKKMKKDDKPDDAATESKKGSGKSRKGKDTAGSTEEGKKGKISRDELLAARGDGQGRGRRPPKGLKSLKAMPVQTSD